MGKVEGLTLFGLLDDPEPPRVCRGCGCTDEDGCLMEIGFAFGSAWIVGCSWVEPDLCSGCAEPEHRVKGPVVDHRLVQAGTGADDAAPAGESGAEETER